MQLQRAMVLAAIYAAVRDSADSEKMRAVVAHAVLTGWHTAFIAKAQGGVDEFGNRWKPLHPSTVRRKQRQSMAQDVDRRRAWGQRRGQLVSQLIAGGMSSADAKVKANSLMWQGSTSAAGGQPINIDTTRLEASLDPAREDHVDQVRDTSSGVRVGTRRPRAKHINRQRRFQPTKREAAVWVRRGADIVRNMIKYEIASKV